MYTNKICRDNHGVHYISLHLFFSIIAIVPVDSDLLVLSLIQRNSCFPLAIIMARRGGGIDHHHAL